MHSKLSNPELASVTEIELPDGSHKETTFCPKTGNKPT
jgi:hypothetical protein